ncbi:MAG: hypothetical protein IPG07_05810 [Crocinitomicaceae bacterium]|nr:hypothetical protein [Crocinitomicaceae bacterium]
MKSIQIIFGIALVFLSACKQENQKSWTTVEVHITDRITGEPVPIVHAEVSEYNHPRFIHNYLDIHMETSDSYKFGFKAKQNSGWTYNLSTFFDLDIYGSINHETGEGLEKNTDNVFHYEVASVGNLQINVQNTSCYDDNDKCYIMKKNLVIPEKDPTIPALFVGCYDGALATGKAYAGTYVLTWEVIKNNVTQNFSDTTYLAPGESLTYDILY